MNHVIINPYKQFDSAGPMPMLGFDAPIQNHVSEKRAGYSQKLLSSTLVILLLLGSYFSFIDSTVSYFTDSASSANSNIYSGTLKFKIVSSDGFRPKKLKKGSYSIRTAKVLQEGTLNFQYQITSEIVSED